MKKAVRRTAIGATAAALIGLYALSPNPHERDGRPTNPKPTEDAAFSLSQMTPRDVKFNLNRILTCLVQDSPEDQRYYYRNVSGEYVLVDMEPVFNYASRYGLPKETTEGFIERMRKNGAYSSANSFINFVTGSIKRKYQTPPLIGQ